MAPALLVTATAWDPGAVPPAVKLNVNEEGNGVSAAVTVRVTGTLNGLFEELLVAVKITLPVYTPVGRVESTLLLMETVSEPGVEPFAGVTVSQLPLLLLVVAATV